MRALACLLAFALLLTTSCARDAGAPQLIEVRDVVPSEVEAGDRLEVLGAYFPQGKHAKLTFHGELRRAGEKSERAEILADGDTTSATQIEVEFTEGLQQLFCGVGESAAHTTFTGDVDVSFVAASAGAPPVNATLHGITLDVRAPSARRALLDARVKEGERALAFMGIHPQATAPPSGGIVVEAVAAGSPAEQAGILASDLLTSLDKVRIDSFADVVPTPGRAVVALGVRRGASATEITREVRMSGYRGAPPLELYAAVILVAVAAAALLLFLAPTVGLLTWIERRVAASTRQSPPGGALAAIAGSGKTRAGFARYLVFVALSVFLVIVPFGQYLIAADLDVGILYVLAVTMVATVALVARPSSGDRTFVRGLRQAALLLSHGLLGAIAVACIVMMTGSLRLQEIIHAQGGWPWEWFLFKTPVTFALFFLFLATTLPHSEQDGHAARARFFVHAEWASVFVMCGLAAALFLGGWQVPGLPSGAQEAHAGLQALGAVVFLAKVWALLAGVAFLRWTLPRADAAPRMALCWKWLVPGALVALLLSALWVAWTPARNAQTAIGALLFAVFCAGVARFVVRVRHDLRTPNGEARLNPFL